MLWMSFSLSHVARLPLLHQGLFSWKKRFHCDVLKMYGKMQSRIEYYLYLYIYTGIHIHIIYIYMSSRQNPLHLHSCYCCGYRFLGGPIEIQHEAKIYS